MTQQQMPPNNDNPGMNYDPDHPDNYIEPEIDADVFDFETGTEISEDGNINDTPSENNVPSFSDNNSTINNGNIKLGKVISGKAATNIINIFIPSFIVFAFKRSGYNVDKKQFRLNAEEKEIFAPVIQDCLDYMTVKFDNPFYALAFVAVFIYGSKVVDAVPELKKLAGNDVQDAEITAEQNPYLESGARAREKINGTNSRNEKLDYIIEAMREVNVAEFSDIQLMYLSIYPEKKESQFKTWYKKNAALLPESMQFPIDYD